MFNKQNFCHVASNNRNEKKAGIFVYKTTDDLATVSTSGYFNEKIIDINLHDLIIHEWHDPADRTKVQKNVLCVTERTLDNVGTVVIKSKWEEDIEDAIEDLQQYVDSTFVRKDGTSVMTGPLKFEHDTIYRGAITSAVDGLMFGYMDTDHHVYGLAQLTVAGFRPLTDNTHTIGTQYYRWKELYLGTRLYTPVINNGYDIAVPVTNSADTFALKSEVDLAANSGDQLYTTGVWYAKMYAATVVPTGAEYDGRNYADFSQVDNDNNPIIVIYEGQSGAWVQIATITPPATYNGYMTITSKIWDIPEQAGQQGGKVLWSHNQKTFTPYPQIVSFDSANITNSTITTSTFSGEATLSGNSTITMPGTPTSDNIANKGYVDTAISTMISTGIFELLYPVGSIYIGTQNTCPLATLIPGSTWEQIQGRYLLASGTIAGTTESVSAGSTCSAGAPNIYGYITDVSFIKNPTYVAQSALYCNDWHNDNLQNTSGQGDGAGTLQVDASRFNSIYGASATIRPAGYAVNVWRRTA